MSLTKPAKIVLGLLILAIIFGYALTPLGFETLTPDLRTWAIVPFFAAASSIGFLLYGPQLAMQKKAKR